ncbi:MAG: GNAT family N-acetyltransferase [Chloroflexi bacterium]|nr:GNAT family N-acetyltransferase [Chloroflexota bacterium]
MVAQRTYVVSGAMTRIRRFTRHDVDRWLDWSDHPDPLYSTYNPVRISGSMRDAWYDDLVYRQGQIPFAVDNFDGDMIGRIFLRQIRRAEGAAVLGIDFAPEFVGRGFGTDALQAFMHHYFGTMGFRRLLLSVAAYNERARRSYERCGFTHVSSHWDVLKLQANVFHDPYYQSIREFFRRGPKGVEALFYTMVAHRPKTRPAP